MAVALVLVLLLMILLVVPPGTGGRVSSCKTLCKASSCTILGLSWDKSGTTTINNQSYKSQHITIMMLIVTEIIDSVRGKGC